MEYLGDDKKNLSNFLLNPKFTLDKYFENNISKIEREKILDLHKQLAQIIENSFLQNHISPDDKFRRNVILSSRQSKLNENNFKDVSKVTYNDICSDWAPACKNQSGCIYTDCDDADPCTDTTKCSDGKEHCVDDTCGDYGDCANDKDGCRPVDINNCLDSGCLNDLGGVKRCCDYTDCQDTDCDNKICGDANLCIDSGCINKADCQDGGETCQDSGCTNGRLVGGDKCSDFFACADTPSCTNQFFCTDQGPEGSCSDSGCTNKECSDDYPCSDCPCTNDTKCINSGTGCTDAEGMCTNSGECGNSGCVDE